MKTLTIMAKAISAGLIILIILAIGLFILKPVVGTIFPPVPVEGMGIVWDANFGRYLNFVFTMAFLSLCFAGFISGFLVGVWGERTRHLAWQSFVSSFIVGISGSLFFFYPRFLLDLALNFMLGVTSALIGWLAYYLSRRISPDR